MDFAKDSSGNHIQAVNGSRWTRYLCINCEGEVKLAKGQKKQPYFFHLAGRHPQSCEEYFTSHYIPGILSGGSTSEKSTYRSLPNYKLDLELNTKNFPDLWRLELYLPQNINASGDSLIIDTGKGTKNIILEELKIRGLYLPMHPIGREYITIPRPNYASYFNINDNIKYLNYQWIHY